MPVAIAGQTGRVRGRVRGRDAAILAAIPTGDVMIVPDTAVVSEEPICP